QVRHIRLLCVSCVVCRVSCVVCRVSCVVCRVSCVVCRVSCCVCRETALRTLSWRHAEDHPMPHPPHRTKSTGRTARLSRHGHDAFPFVTSQHTHKKPRQLLSC